jgi:hypothetical protein
MDFGALPNGRANAPEISNTLLPLWQFESWRLSRIYVFKPLPGTPRNRWPVECPLLRIDSQRSGAEDRA